MKTLNVGSLKIPASAATKSFAILAKRGAGKTYTGAVFAEEMAEVGIPFVVFDPIDVWWGLRVAANGKDKGLPVVVFGMEHADIQITKDDGPKIARAIVKENISCVISTFGMSKTAMRHLIAEFAEELIKINDTPRHIFIEEAHEFVPQRVQSGAGKCFAAVEALVVMGRNRGLGVSLINQRAATLNKDVLTQVDTLVAMRSVGPQDRKALKEWVEAHSAEGDFNDFITSLPSLPTGEAWVWSPEFMGIFERIQIRKRRTFHPDREKLGQNFKIPNISQTDIKGFIEGFSAKKPVVAPATPGVKHATVSSGIEKHLQQENNLLRSELEKAQVSAKKWESYATMLEINAQEGGKTMAMIIRNEKPKSGPHAARLIPGIEKIAQRQIMPPQAQDVPAPAAYNGPVEGKLDGAARKVYGFLLANPDRAFSKIQLGAVTGYSPKSGGFNNALYRLNSLGLSQKRGTDIQLNAVDPSLADSGDVWSIALLFEKLPGAEKKIMQFLLTNSSGRWSKEQIAMDAGYSPTSGGFNNSLYHLNSMGLIDRSPEGIQINQELLEL